METHALAHLRRAHTIMQFGKQSPVGSLEKGLEKGLKKRWAAAWDHAHRDETFDLRGDDAAVRKFFRAAILSVETPALNLWEHMHKAGHQDAHKAYARWRHMLASQARTVRRFLNREAENMKLQGYRRMEVWLQLLQGYICICTRNLKRYKQYKDKIAQVNDRAQ